MAWWISALMIPQLMRSLRQNTWQLVGGGMRGMPTNAASRRVLFVPP